MRKSTWTLLGLVLLMAQPAMAEDLVAGRAKVRTMCQNCHGEDGVAVIPGAANLSGQQREYLRGQLRSFRSGSRQDPIMSLIAKALTDAEIDDVAFWYSSIKVSVEAPR